MSSSLLYIDTYQGVKKEETRCFPHIKYYSVLIPYLLYGGAITVLIYNFVCEISGGMHAEKPCGVIAPIWYKKSLPSTDTHKDIAHTKSPVISEKKTCHLQETLSMVAVHSIRQLSTS